MDLTELIKIICIKRKISMSELAEKSGQSNQNLANKLKRNDFKTSELEKIAAALDLRLEINFVDNATEQPLISETENLIGEISAVLERYKKKEVKD